MDIEVTKVGFAHVVELARIQSLQKVHLSDVGSDVTVLKVLHLLKDLKKLRILRLEGLDVEEVKGDIKVKFILPKLETVQLWGLKLTNDHLTKGGLLYNLAAVSALSLRGANKITEEGLLLILSELKCMKTLTLDARTDLKVPLSVLLDTQHAAPLEEVNLFNYELASVFTEKSLDTILDEKRTPNSKIKRLKIERSSGGYYLQNMSLPLVFQALFFLLPFLETLDLTHQFIGNPNFYELPNNGLQSLKVCSRHDTSKLINPNHNCVALTPDCSPWLEEKAKRDYWGRMIFDEEESSDSEFQYHLGDLFDD
jgi:hypothetical protein